MRYALIAGHNITTDVIARYLPANYEVVVGKDDGKGYRVLIKGEDNLGWTMDDYVLPRLASGLWFGKEIEKLEADAFDLAIDLAFVEGGPNR